MSDGNELSRESQFYYNRMIVGREVMVVVRPDNDYSAVAGFQFWPAKRVPARTAGLILYGPDVSAAKTSRSVRVPDEPQLLAGLLNQLQPVSETAQPTVTLEGGDLRTQGQTVTIEFVVQDLAQRDRLIDILRAYIAYLENEKTASS